MPAVTTGSRADAVVRAPSSTIALSATVRQRLERGVAPTRPLWAALVPGVRSVGRSGSGRIRRASRGHRLHDSRAFAVLVVLVRGREANAEPLRNRVRRRKRTHDVVIRSRDLARRPAHCEF
jgi:hypothetical protein